MNTKMHWVDLPQDDYSQILGYSNQQVANLNDLVCAYFDLEQNDEDSLPIRVERLEDIIDYLNEWTTIKLSSIDKPKHLKILKEIAEEKRNYLLALVKISQLGDEASQYLEYYHHPDIEQSEYKVVYLNPKRLYSVKKREYWGDFWWVSLDPCHRQLTSYLMLWEQQHRNDDSKAIDFFLWLETQNVPKNFPTEKYLSDEELDATELAIHNGLLCKKSDENHTVASFNTQDKKYLYAIGLDKKLRVLEETSEIYHSSFYSGKPVFTAGKLRIQDGLITAVSFESGHYIPSIEVGYQLFDILSKKGLKLAEKTEVSYFYDRNKYTTIIEKNFLNNLDTFKTFIENSVNSEVCSKAG